MTEGQRLRAQLGGSHPPGWFGCRPLDQLPAPWRDMVAQWCASHGMDDSRLAIRWCPQSDGIALAIAPRGYFFLRERSTCLRGELRLLARHLEKLASMERRVALISEFGEGAFRPAWSFLSTAAAKALLYDRGLNFSDVLHSLSKCANGLNPSAMSVGRTRRTALLQRHDLQAAFWGDRFLLGGHLGQGVWLEDRGDRRPANARLILPIDLPDTMRAALGGGGRHVSCVVEHPALADEGATITTVEARAGRTLVDLTMPLAPMADLPARLLEEAASIGPDRGVDPAAPWRFDGTLRERLVQEALSEHGRRRSSTAATGRSPRPRSARLGEPSSASARTA